MLEQAAIELSLYARDARGEPRVATPDELPAALPEPADLDAACVERERREAAGRRPEPAALRSAARARARRARVGRQPAAPRHRRDGGRLARPRRGSAEPPGPGARGRRDDRHPHSQPHRDGRSQRAAGAAMARADAQRRFALDRVEADVRDAVSALEAARQRVAVARRELGLARDLAARERERMALGDGTVLVLNLRETAAAEASMREVDALVDWRSAAAAGVSRSAARAVGRERSPKGEAPVRGAVRVTAWSRAARARPPRATAVSALPRRAPRRRRRRAHRDARRAARASVAPVVTTSSTRSTRAPRTRGLATKASRTLRPAGRAVETGLRGRVSHAPRAVEEQRGAERCGRARESSADWLKPRERSRAGCSGTGTTASITPFVRLPRLDEERAERGRHAGVVAVLGAVHGAGERAAVLLGDAHPAGAASSAATRCSRHRSHNGNLVGKASPHAAQVTARRGRRGHQRAIERARGACSFAPRRQALRARGCATGYVTSEPRIRCARGLWGARLRAHAAGDRGEALGGARPRTRARRDAAGRRVPRGAVARGHVVHRSPRRARGARRLRARVEALGRCTRCR